MQRCNDVSSYALRHSLGIRHSYLVIPAAARHVCCCNPVMMLMRGVNRPSTIVPTIAARNTIIIASSIDGSPATGAADEIVKHYSSHHCCQQNQAVVLHETADAQNELCYGRQRFVTEQIMKNFFKPWHDEHEQETQDSNGHGHHDDRINHCREHFVLNLRGFLLKFRKAVKNQLEHAADFAGFYHVDVEVVKDSRMQRQRVGKRAATLHRVGQIVDGFFQQLVAFLLCQNI